VAVVARGLYEGGIVGIDVQHASKRSDMHCLMLKQMPFTQSPAPSYVQI